MAHEAGQVFQITPEPVQLRDRFVDRDALVDVHAGPSAKRPSRVFPRTRSIEAQHFVGVAVATQPAAKQHGADTGQDPAGWAASADAIGGEADASRHRSPAFGFADVPSTSRTIVARVIGELKLHVIHRLSFQRSVFAPAVGVNDGGSLAGNDSAAAWSTMSRLS